jgi:signal transduction histidine kinase
LEEFQKREGIQCRVKCEGEEVKDERYATVLFRVFQEALTNISRHARASEAKVHLRVDNESVALEISDNGRGIAPEEINDKNAIGLIGMRERVSFLQGKLDIRGIENRGTILKITLPLKGRTDD